MDQHVILHKQHPDLKRTEITRKIGQEWKALPDFVKEPYIVAANAERQKYKEEVKIYEDHLTPLEKKVQKAERQQKLAKRKSSRKRRELINMGKPKRARNAFNIFMSEHFQDASGMKAKEKFKSLFDDWGILESSRKQTYIQLAEDDKIRYENEMKSWEEQMIEIGREDLIRLKQRNKLKKLRPILKGPKVASKKKKTSVSRLKQSRKTAEPNEGRKARSRISRHEE
ncbi:transcription factor A, mitochondrial isoform X2 [Ascaphus truei]